MRGFHELAKPENVSFSYERSGDKSSSTDFCYDIELERGEIIALTGESGSGKSTLLDLIAGFLLPQTGSIVLNDVDISKMHPGERNISILFQNHNVFEHLSVIENVELGLGAEARSSVKQSSRISQILSAMGLEKFHSRKTSELSGGQMQRVALARELLRDTHLLLLDEPFNGLDEETREQILPLLKHFVSDQKRSILLITHDLDSIRSIVDRHIEMRDGQLFRVEN